MAHFTKFGLNSVVIDICTVDNTDILDDNGNESESKGVALLLELTGYPFWTQTSYNNNFRKNYAGIGYTYDAIRDAFIPPQNYSSWILNEDTCQWEAPFTYPMDGSVYIWNEETLNWVIRA